MLAALLGVVVLLAWRWFARLVAPDDVATVIGFPHRDVAVELRERRFVMSGSFVDRLRVGDRVRLVGRVFD